MLPHWIRYYDELGVPLDRARIYLDNLSAASAAQAAHVLSRHRVPFFFLNRSDYSTELRLTRLRLLNSFIAGLPATAYVLPADIDELYSFPCNAAALIASRKER